MSAAFYRSYTDVIIGGVCGGLAAYMRVNPILVRLFFLLMIFGNGIGILLYLLLWIIMPLDGNVIESISVNKFQQIGLEGERPPGTNEMGMRIYFRNLQTQLSLLVGMTLILVGFLFLIPCSRSDLFTWLNFDLAWPILMTFGGFILLIRRRKGDSSNGRYSTE
jgi:phage shock protein C